jgi:antitoxin MazE
MKSQIIQIGNSQGIRIPKVLLEESGISGEVGLELRPEGILIRNIGKPRANWDAAFASVADVEDDEVIAPDTTTQFEVKEWQW